MTTLFPVFLENIKHKRMRNCTLQQSHSNSFKFETELNALLKQNCSCQDVAMSEQFAGIMFKCFDLAPRIPRPFQMAFFCAIGLIAFLSICANSIVIWIILRHPVMRQRAPNRQVFNLAISDLCLTLFNTIPVGIANVLESWPFPAWLCSFQQMIAVVPFCASVFTMVLISLDRYYAILYPLHPRPWGDPESRRFNTISLSAVWVFGLLFSLPEFFIYNAFEDAIAIEKDENGANVFLGTSTFCDPIDALEFSNFNKIYNWTMLVLQFLLPILTLAIAYCRIAFELYWNKGPDNSTGLDSILGAKRRTAKLFALLVFSFLALWLPYEMMFTVPDKLFIQSWPSGFKVLRNLAFLLAMSSTVVSPIIYFNMSERFYIGFCYALRWVPFWRGGGITKAQYMDVFALNGPQLSRMLLTTDNKRSSQLDNDLKQCWQQRRYTQEMRMRPDLCE